MTGLTYVTGWGICKKVKYRACKINYIVCVIYWRMLWYEAGVCTRIWQVKLCVMLCVCMYVMGEWLWILCVNKVDIRCRRMFITVFCQWERTPSAFGNAFTWHLAYMFLTAVQCPVSRTDWTVRLGSFIKQKVWL